MIKFLRVILYSTTGLVLTFLADKLALHLAATFPENADAIRHALGLALVLVLGVFILRPILKLYQDDPKKSRKAP